MFDTVAAQGGPGKRIIKTAGGRSEKREMDGNRSRSLPSGRRAWSSRERARELGERVRARRKALGLTQEQLGEVCGLHRTYVGQVERGDVNVSLKNLLALAGGLGVDLGELVQGLRQAG